MKLARIAALRSPQRVIVDFESRSILELTGKKGVGAAVYAEHPSTKLLIAKFKLRGKNHSIVSWCPYKGDPFPDEVLEWLEKGYTFEAFNAGFEKAVWAEQITKKLGIKMPEHWVDVQAACAYRALPVKLEKANKALNLDVQKNPRGKQLIGKLCKPQKWLKNDLKLGLDKLAPDGIKWCDDPVLLDEFEAYCEDDVYAEEALADAIKDLTEEEYEVWCLDQLINERGVFIDTAVVAAADRIRQDYAVLLTKELSSITGGQVTSADQVAAIKKFCEDQGCLLPDLTADTVEEMVLSDYPSPLVKRVLQIRKSLGMKSVAKISKFFTMLCLDSRIRGLLQYHGASTGRWAGRGVQPQNFPRGDEDILQPAFIGKARLKKEPHLGMELLVQAIMTGDWQVVEMVYGDPYNALASALRGFIIAQPGEELFVADFSAIEARVLAWVAGEQWKLDAFAAIDRGEGYKGSADIYLATASMVFGYPCLTKDTHGKERQTGKTCELAFGYQGGVGAWRKFDDSDKWTDDQVNEHKESWRAAHPRIKAFWYEIEDTAIKALLNPGKKFSYRGVSYCVVNSDVGKWLACQLPNGRCLWYFNPEARHEGINRYTGQPKYTIFYDGKNNKRGGNWEHISTYGGSLTENIVQAISRDIMVEAMFRVEAAGYRLILTVHDELVCERRIGTGSMKEFYALVAAIPKWMPGFPIGVAGFKHTRYFKG